MKIITDKQSDMITLIIEGKNITEISRVMNISRQTIYTWLKLEHVKNEIEYRKTTLRKQASDRIVSRVDMLVDNIFDLACNSKDQRVKLQAIKYLMDRALGSPTTAKEETINTDIGDKDKDSNTLKNELNEIKNLTVVK